MEQDLPDTLCGDLLANRDVVLDFRARAQQRRQRTFWSVATNLQQRFCCSSLIANIAIRARRRRTRGAVDDVCFIFLHEIQKRPVSGVFARRFFSFDTAANGVDGLPERIFADGPFHLTELGGRRVLQLRGNRGLRLDNDRIGRLGGPTGCGSLDVRRDPGRFCVLGVEMSGLVADVGDGSSVFAIAGFTFAVSGWSWMRGQLCSTGSLSAVLLKQPNPFASVHASMLACGGKGQLQPTRVAARAPMRSVLMHSLIRGLSSARSSCGDHIMLRWLSIICAKVLSAH